MGFERLRAGKKPTPLQTILKNLFWIWSRVGSPERLIKLTESPNIGKVIQRLKTKPGIMSNVLATMPEKMVVPFIKNEIERSKYELLKTEETKDRIGKLKGSIEAVMKKWSGAPERGTKGWGEILDAIVDSVDSTESAMTKYAIIIKATQMLAKNNRPKIELKAIQEGIMGDIYGHLMKRIYTYFEKLHGHLAGIIAWAPPSAELGIRDMLTFRKDQISGLTIPYLMPLIVGNFIEHPIITEEEGSDLIERPTKFLLDRLRKVKREMYYNMAREKYGIESPDKWNDEELVLEVEKNNRKRLERKAEELGVAYEGVGDQELLDRLQVPMLRELDSRKDKLLLKEAEQKGMVGGTDEERLYKIRARRKEEQSGLVEKLNAEMARLGVKDFETLTKEEKLRELRKRMPEGIFMTEDEINRLDHLLRDPETELLKEDEQNIITRKKMRGVIEHPDLSDVEKEAFELLAKEAFAMTGQNIILESQKEHPVTKKKPTIDLGTAMINIKFFLPEKTWKEVFKHMYDDKNFHYKLLEPHLGRVSDKKDKKSAVKFINKSVSDLKKLEFPPAKQFNAVKGVIQLKFPSELKGYGLKRLKMECRKL